MPAAIELVKQNPDQPFVIDHIAKPYIKDGLIDDWKKGHAGELHNFQMCLARVSGMVTEADWKNWKPADFTPYLDTVTEAFGTNRLLYGSDWPVCLVAASYTDMIGMVRNYFLSFSPAEQEAVFGGNAAKFYQL